MLRNDEVEYTHDAEPKADDPNAQNHVVVITARHIASGVFVTGNPVKRFSGKPYWLERNRLHDELEKKLTQ